MHSEYRSRLTRFANMINSMDRDTMLSEINDLKKDLQAVRAGLQVASKEYNAATNDNSTTMKQKRLCWSVHEHSVMQEHIAEGISTLESFCSQLAKVGATMRNYCSL